MRKSAISVALAMLALPACAQTLREALQKAGIPTTRFAPAELAKQADAASGRDGSQTYVAYVIVGANNILTDTVGLVSYDKTTRAVLSYKLKPEEMENCCGSPLDIEFTQSYLLVSFHYNPSANTVLVTNRDLKYRTTLYGIGFYEIAPDQLVYVEDEVHFAAQHPERLAWADLQNGRAMELYPPKGDALRAQFAAINEEHMPAEALCQQANDPCDPAIYDENIEFLSADGHGGFKIRVTRDGGHPWVTKDEPVEVPHAAATYTYWSNGDQWMYCEEVERTAGLVKDANRGATKGSAIQCEPKLPVVPDGSGLGNPFGPHTGKAN